jgi:hypothetical protein
VTELVEQVLSFQPTSTPAERLAKLGEGLALSGLATDEALPLLAEWLALPETAGYAPLRISPDLKRRKLLDILAVWNLKLGELQPMVVLVEDLHWCDPSSLELIGRLIVQGATTRILLIATTRPEFANPWPPRSNLRTLILDRLTAGQVDNARGAIEMGLAIGAQTAQSFFDSELHRLQGEIALRTVGGQPSAMDPETTAEGCFRRALDIARAHEAKSFELRAAIPLARLWLVLGKRAAARELIAPIRAWFAEGFDTGDLVDAKALLDELA